MRRLVVSVLGLTLTVLSSAPVTAGALAGPFPDVPSGYWAASAIAQLKAQGVVSGEADGKFHPLAPVTREQFAAMIVRALRLPAASAGPAFGDVPAGGLSPFIETAAANGLMLGTSLTTFAPFRPITRAMAATIAIRSLGLQHVGDDLQAISSGYTDKASIPAFAQGSVVAARRLGIMQGYASGAFRPQVTLDRAQAAVLIVRLESVPASSTAHLSGLVASRVSAGGSQDTIPVGGSTGLWYGVFDRSGNRIPAGVSWSASGGTVSGGRFFASAPGVYTVTARVPGTSVEHSFPVTVDSPTSLAIYGLPEVAGAGSKVQGTVTVLSQLHSRDTVDGSRTVTLTFTATGGTTETETLTAVNGQAGFSFTPPAAGTYDVTAAASGVNSASAAFDVLAEPFGQLAVQAPSTILPGTSADIHISLPQGASESSPVSVTSSDPSVVRVGSGGGLSAQGLTVQAMAGSPGQATITVANPLGAYSSVALSLSVPALGSLSLLPPPVTAAGAAASVAVGVLAAGGVSAPPPDVHLNLQNPQGVAVSDLSTVASGAQALFQLSEREAGNWTLTATAPGYAPATATWTVTPGAPTQLIATGAPSTIVVQGQSVALQVQLADQYDNPVPAPVSVQLAASGTAGTLSAASASLSGPGAAAEFAAAEPGVEQVTVTPVGTAGLRPVTVDFRVVASAADVTAGKGFWLLESDWRSANQAQLLTQLEGLGVTHVYLEVEESSLGFYGSSALRHFLYAAHDQGIAVIAWVYPYLHDVGYDAALTAQVAAYTAPTGDRPDGVAADIETNTSASAVGQYAQAVRQAMGPSGVFIAVTYPPVYHESYPYSALAPYVTLFAPMDYWHYQARDWNFLETYQYVSQTISLIRQLSGDPNAQVSVIGQTYDMFSGSGTGVFSPTPMEVQAAFQAASDGGALGISFYRLATATSAELQAIGELPFPDQSR